MTRKFWATRRAAIAANKAAVTVEPATPGTVVEPVEIPTAETATKAELIAAAEAAGIDFKSTESKAEIAAKLASG
jgi:ABC-type taurine transport system substrate-binding protein